uniref:Enoyl reductase (ER) domain-containing protein n=1 Tax=Pseudictyota dubia TaxID=2749911 RepID=A0A7R9WJG4_9STRA|mmetsp:Transcript_8056/g.14687  ORF Transcript_8056/g.14687 Transcript_8056/m.14687 type:complete len:381 (+) Transcript_8056:75-1217(+)
MSNRTEDTTTSKSTMKVAVATGFGDIDSDVHIRTDWPRPSLKDDDIAFYKKQHDIKPKDDVRFMVIRVLSCALAPGDVRILSGKTSYMQLPPGGHPYVPGSDVCGVVEEVQDGETKFKVGDVVVSRFDEPRPLGGLAEYRLVRTDLSERAPTKLSPEQCCGLPASGMAAKLLAERYVQGGDRVLILGGSGGVGTMLCQYVKLRGASFIAATSTTKALVESLGADVVIDYRTTNWWEMEEFQKEKFDVVLDLVGGDNWEKGGLSGKAIKRGATYAALVTGVRTEIVVQNTRDVIYVVLWFMSRILRSRLDPRVPRWVAPEALELREGYLAGLFRDFDEGRIRPVLDPASPFPFTEEGVREAFRLQKSIHAHGKVVVKVSDP